jgi:predicted ester cyclase
MKKLIIIATPFLIGAAFLLSACGGKGGANTSAADSAAMMVQKNKQTAMASEMAINKHDGDGVFKDCAPDYVDNGSGESKPMKADSAKASFKQFLVAFPDLKGDNLVCMGQGDTVVVMGTWTGTFKKAFGGMKPTGKAFKVFDEDIFSFNKDGKITSHKSVQSINTYISQVSAVTPAGH